MATKQYISNLRVQKTHAVRPTATPALQRLVNSRVGSRRGSCILSIRDFVRFVFGSFMLPHLLPLPVIPEVSRSSTGSLRNLSPACERWHLASALTVSVPAQRGQSAVAQVGQFFF